MQLQAQYQGYLGLVKGYCSCYLTKHLHFSMTAPLCCVCIPPVNTKNLLTAFCFKHKIFLLVTLSKVLQTPQLSFRELALTATGLIGGGWYGGNPWDPMAACVDRRSLGICLKATNKNAQLSFGKHQKALILDPPGKTGAVEF